MDVPTPSVSWWADSVIEQNGGSKRETKQEENRTHTQKKKTLETPTIFHFQYPYAGKKIMYIIRVVCFLIRF